VNIPPQAPDPGQALRITSKRSSSEIFPVAYAPTLGELGIILESERIGQRHTICFERVSDVYWITFLEAEGRAVNVPDTRLYSPTVDDNSRYVHPEGGDSTTRHVFVAT